MPRCAHLLLGLLILCGVFARSWRLAWGQDPFQGVFRALHPDERSLVRASSQLRLSLKPAITSYGALALYLPWLPGWPLARACGRVPLGLEDDGSRALTYLAARGLSAAAAIAALGLTFLLARRLGGQTAGWIGACLLAVAVLPIQQAHFYTVDSLLCAAMLGGLLLALPLATDRRWPSWVGVGVAAGAAAALRSNGLLLLLPPALAALWPTSGLRPRPAHLTAVGARLAAAGAAAAATLVILQPYMVLDPAHYFALDGSGNLRTAMAMAQGDITRVFTLYDSAQTPYLFHLRSLRLAVGPALLLAGLAGLAWLAWRRRGDAAVVAAWFAVQFVLLGRLEAKNTRYLLPLVPLLCAAAGALLAAGIEHARRRVRWLALATGAIVLAATTLYAAAYLRVYAQPHNRLAAADALLRLFPRGAAIGYEPTGVAMAELVPDGALDFQPDPLGVAFNLDGFLLQADRVLLFLDWLEGLDGLVLVDVARQRHFEARPDRYPVEAEFCRRLRAGQLGFEVVADCATGPGIGPWSLDDRTGDPSFYGYDHPRVTVLRAAAGADLPSLAREWTQRLRQDPDGLDGQVLRAGQRLQAGDVDGAARALERAEAGRPGHRLVALLRCELFSRTGDSQAAAAQWNAFVDGLGPAGREGIWEHEILGLEYAGRTLQRLGAAAIGQRCLDAATRLR